MTNIPHGRIDDTEDAWDPDGPLGNDEKYVERAPAGDAAAVDAALGLQPISIRLQRDLLDNLKALAQLHGLGYQPLIRQVLTRFVDCELKAMLRDRVERESAAGSCSTQPASAPAESRKAA